MLLSALVGILLLVSFSAEAQVSGTVYREFKMNGLADPAVSRSFSSVGGVSSSIQTRFAETGLAGALLTVYGDNELVLGTATSAANGSWSVTVPVSYTGTQVLVECRLPASLSALTSGPRGTDNRTTVAVVARNTTNVNFSFGVGSEHAQDSPQVAFACFALPQPSNTTGSPGSGEPMVIRFPYLDGGPLTNATRFTTTPTTATGQNYYADGQNPAVTSKTVLTTFGETGTVYGVAYDKRRNRLLTSAFERAYTGIGPNGTGGEGKLYVTTLNAVGNATATALWLDLETALSAGVAGTDPAITAGLSFTNTVAGITNPVTVQRFEHNKVGHLSLGDLEFSADGRTVFVVNLFSRQIYGIPLNADGTPNTAGIRTYTPTNPCAAGSFTDPTPPSPAARNYNAIMGLGIHPENGRVYCTVTCTGPTDADLNGTVYSFDPTAATTTFRQELQIPLDFTLQTGGTGTEGIYGNQANVPWTSRANNSVVSNDLTNNNVEHALLADIVFDIAPDGTTFMVVGGRNRFMDATSGSRITTGQGMWLASSNGTSFTLESNGAVGGRTTANTLTLPWFSVRAGNGVFFNTHGSEGAFSTGNMIAIPGFTEIAVGAVDNVRSAGNNGLAFLSRANGVRTRDILLLGSLASGAPARDDVYKANIWGEAEAMLEPAPLEVGNLVFRDVNKNGLQDPSDTPIAGVRVSLVEDTNGDGLPNEPVSATTVTDANGQYYFTQAANGLKYDTKYVLVINRPSDFTTNGGLANTTPATANVSSNAKDTRDSDGEILTGSFVKTAFTTGAPGDNNHLFDFGFEPCTPPSVTFTASSNAVCVGQPVVLTTLVSPAGAYTYAVAGPAGVVITNGTTGTATVTNLNTGVNTFTLTVTSGPTCVTTSVVSVTTSTSPLLSLASSTSAICLGQAVTLSSSLLGGLVPLGPVVFNTVGALGTLVPLVSNIVSPTATTTFLAQVPLIGGLVSSCPVTVIVNSPPALTAVSTSLCVGIPLNLTGVLGQNNILTGLTNTLLGGTTIPANLTVGAGVNLFNVVSTNANGCTAVTPVTVTGLANPSLAPVSVSLCIGSPLNLTSLLGQTNVLTGLTTTLLGGAALPTNLTVGVGINAFNLVSTNVNGCTAVTPVSVTGVNPPVVAPIALSVCAGTTIDLTGLNGLADLTNVFRRGGVLGTGTLLGSPTSVSIGAGVNLFNVVSTNPFGCTTATPISVTGVNPPVVAPIALSLCVGANLDLTSLSGLTGLTNVFRTGSLLGLGTLLGTPTAVSVGAGVNLFNVVSTNPFGCTTATPISVTGVNPPVVAPIALSLCVGANLDLTSLSGLTGLTNVFRTGNLLGLGTLLGTPTAVSIGTGVNLFNVVSTNPFGCTTATPISVTGVNPPIVAPIALSLCVGANLDLTSLSGLTGLTNIFRTGNLLGLGTLLGTPTAVSIGAGVNLFNVVSTNPFGCTTATPILVTGVNPPVVAPIALSLCVGANLDLTSLSGLTGLTNVFRTGNLLGLGTLLGTPTAVSVGAGVNLFNVVSTNPFGCTTATPISVTGVNAPVVAPIALSLCVGANLDLTSLSGLTGLTNVFRTGNLLGLGTLLGTPTAVSIGTGVNLFNVVSTNPFGCTTATPISVTGVNPPVVAPIALSLCVGANLDLTSLSGLTGLTNIFRTGNLLGLGTLINTPTAVNIGAGVNLFNVVSAAPTGCTTATPISVTGVDAPVVGPIALSLCVGANLDLTSLSGLTGLTNVFRTGSLLGLGTLVNTPTSVSIGVGVNLFNVVSTNPFGCTTATPISVTGTATPVLSPINLSLCAGVTLDLTSLSDLAGLTNVFRTGNLLGLGTLLNTPTAVSIGAGVNLFNVVSTSPFGCTAAAPISVTGVDVPVVTPISITLCAAVNAPVNLSALLAGNGSVAGLTNIFRLGGTTGSIIANPLNVGLAAGVNLFTVTSTNPTGCTVITPIDVTLTIKPVISVAAVLQSQTICEGTLPLPIVGTVTSGTIASSLFFGPLTDTTSLFSTTVGAGLTFTPTTAQLPAPGQTVYFALVANSTSTCSDTVFVSITTAPRPVVTTTSLSICLGETVDLTAQLATSAGNSRTFFATRLDATAQVSPLTSLTVTPTLTTTFFTRVTVPLTNCFSIDSIVVTVKPKPSAGSDMTLVCGPLGETPTSATLTATPVGGSWTNGAGNPTMATFTPNAAATTASGLVVGSYQFIYTANGCTDTVAVVVPACQTFCAGVSVTALASSFTLTPGQSVSLSADVSPAGSYTYAWSGPGTLTPANAATVVASGLPTGVSTFTVTVTTKPGCTSTAVVSVTVIAPDLAISVVDPGTCDPGTNTYTTTGIISLTNAIASTLTITDGTSSTTVSVTAGQTTASFSLTGLVSGTGLHTVVVNGIGYPTTSTTYIAPTSCTVAACNYTVAATAASATVTAGQPASLSAIVSPSGSYTYVWSAPDGVAITPANASAVQTSALASGVYTFSVAVTNSLGCTQVATVCVSVPLTPCANSNYAYSLTTVAGFSNYQWQYTAPGSASSTIVQDGTSNSFIATLPGEYRVVVTDASGIGNCPGNTCCPIIIVEQPVPTSLSVTAIAATCSTTSPAAQDDAQLVLAGPVLAGTSYNISSGSSYSAVGALFATNQPLSGLTTGSILRGGLLNPPTAAGSTYTVRVFTADGCFADTVVTIPRSDCQCPPAKCVPITVRKVVKR